MAKDFLLNVQKSNDGQFWVKVHDLLPDETHSFIGIDRAILWMNGRMDQELRDFRRKSKNNHPETVTIPYIRGGQSARFYVRVLYWEQNTWQGEVTWTESGEKKSFRSALELLHLMDSAFD